MMGTNIRPEITMVKCFGQIEQVAYYFFNLGKNSIDTFDFSVQVSPLRLVNDNCYFIPKKLKQSIVDGLIGCQLPNLYLNLDHQRRMIQTAGTYLINYDQNKKFLLDGQTLFNSRSGWTSACLIFVGAFFCLIFLSTSHNYYYSGSILVIKLG